MIKANDPRLHRISVAYEGFIVLEGIPIPEGTPLTRPLFVATPLLGASSSHLILEEEEKEKEEEEKSPEGIIDLSDSLEEFEVFNQTPSPEGISADVDFQYQAELITSDEMGIQRKSQRSLRDLIESQPGKDAPRKSTQPKLPPPPPKSPLPPPQPSLPSKPNPADLKRKREQKGKDVVDAGRSRPAHEDETQRAAK